MQAAVDTKNLWRKGMRYYEETSWPHVGHNLVVGWHDVGIATFSTCGTSPPLNRKCKMQVSWWWRVRIIIKGEDLGII